MLKCGYGQIDKQANEQTDMRVKIVTYVHTLRFLINALDQIGILVGNFVKINKH